MRETGVDEATLQNPFDGALRPRGRNALERFLHISRPGLAVPAIRALLGDNPPGECHSTAISDILRSYGVSGKAARGVLCKVWKEALGAFLRDDTLSSSESDYLRSLKCLLALPDSDTDRAFGEIARPRYRKALAVALEDGVLSADEKQRLENLQRVLRIAPEVRTKILGEEAAPVLQRVLDGAIADRRLSAAEEALLDSICENLGVQLQLDAKTRATMERYKLLWRIENGDIPVIPAPIHLQRAESCFFAAPAQWLEWRKRTRTVGYASSGVSFRIMRGVYYRVGASRPHRVTTEGMEVIDVGSVVITNKRVVFDGQRKNGTWRLTSLLGFEAYSDGFGLEKSTGRCPAFQIDGDAEMAAIILGAALARA